MMTVWTTSSLAIARRCYPAIDNEKKKTLLQQAYNPFACGFTHPLNFISLSTLNSRLIQHLSAPESDDWAWKICLGRINRETHFSLWVILWFLFYYQNTSSASHFPPVNCCLSVVIFVALKRGLLRKIRTSVVFCLINSVLLNLWFKQNFIHSS